MKKYFVLIFSCLASSIVMAQTPELQDSVGTHIGYTLSAEGAVGSGDWTAFQLATNRHSVLGTRSNTANMRVGMDLQHYFSKKYILTGVVDGIGSVHADHKFYLQQAYANMKLNHFFVEAGAREINPILRDPQLCSGAFIESGNAKPIPQVRIGTDGFWTVPYTKKWLEMYFDFAYGYYMENSYLEDNAKAYIAANPYGAVTYMKNKWFHHKQLYFRSNSSKRIFVTIGIDHAVQFGGKQYNYYMGEMTEIDYSPGFKEFVKAIIPMNGSGYADSQDLTQWIVGNHLGSMTYSIGWNINKNHQLIGYLDNIFEDGSGIRKGNGWDGIWGLEYHNKKEGVQYVRDAVFEYVQTTHQSGYIHWDPNDFAYPYNSISDMQDAVTGNDDYYNNGQYIAYTQFGICQGNPLVTSPIYNKDGNNRFEDNTVKAWHLGVRGDICQSRYGDFGYLFRGSYREGKGTHSSPIYPKRHNFGAMVQVNWHRGSWNASAAYALDNGNVYGNNNTFDLTISYHGKIL